LTAISINAEGLYVDGTFGRGGHSSEVLQCLSEQGRLMAFDKDLDAIEFGKQRFLGDERLSLVHASFADMKAVIEERGLLGKVDGILLDLGVSSPQLDEAGRGFSFLRDGPLDMRMDNTSGQSVAEWLAEAERWEIKKVLHVYGEEKFAALIAKKIVERRDEQPFTTTLDLADFIEAIIPKKVQVKSKKHAATRSFQALRIHINKELEDLENLLKDVLSILKPGGRLAVISFHSLEDRIVKHFIRAQEKGPTLPRNIPIIELKRDDHMISVGKAIKASVEELDENIRSRSAVLRIAEKVVAG
jgi:16S rRNA (cytosine1402-N4)-methyltransferase